MQITNAHFVSLKEQDYYAHVNKHLIQRVMPKVFKTPDMRLVLKCSNLANAINHIVKFLRQIPFK